MKLSDSAEAAYHRQIYASPGESIQGVRIFELKRFHDAGGALTELVRLEAGAVLGVPGFEVRQVNYSTLEPGAIKAFHVHRLQSDLWFVPPSDRVLLVLADVRAGSPTEGRHVRRVLGDTRSALVLIPPGVAHGCRNLGSAAAHLLYFTDRHFAPEPDRTDEGRLPWDFLGAAVWDVPRE